MSDDKPNPSNPASERICGSGEMAERIRIRDWSQTPLGPFERWSDTLVASVNFLLSSPFTFALYWGDEHTLLYNDPYRDLLNQKHPAALGKKGIDVWAEAWPIIGPPIEEAYREGRTTNEYEVLIPILVDGAMRDGWYTYGLHPVYENGRIVGVGNPGQDNTSAVLARKAVFDSEAELSQVLGATTDAIVSVNRDWVMTYLNPKAMEVYSAERNVVGMTVWDAFPQAVYEGSPFVEHYYRAMEERIAGRFESFYPAPLNIWIRLEVYPVPDGIVTFSRDVTMEKKEQLLRQEREARLTIATQALQLGIFTWDPKTDSVVWENDRMYAVLGRGREQGPLNARVFVEEKIVPEFAAGFERALSNAVASGAPFRYECKVRMDDASDKWISFTGQMAMHPDGTPSRMIGVVQDISEARDGQEALRRSEERLRLAQDSAKISSWEWDLASGNFIWDEGSAWTYGRPQGDMTHVDQIFPYLVEEDRARVAEDLKPAVEGRGNYRSQFRVVWPDGSVHWLDAWGKTRFGLDGRPEKLIGVNIDVTERHQAQSALIQNEKLAAVGKLASSIAHEINNPLESVTNLLYLARRSEDLSEIHEYVDTAEAELRRVSNIANQTLRFHRQSSKPTNITCLELFSTVLSMYEGRLKNSNITVSKRKRANKPVVVYEGDIRQVLNNVIGNAIDAMPMGGRLIVRSRNATDWKTGEHGIALTVADTGSGIAPQKMAKIFDAFFTTKGISGSGLGLWISQEIMQRHAGHLRIRSSQTPGHQGTVATIFMPFVNPVSLMVEQPPLVGLTG